MSNTLLHIHRTTTVPDTGRRPERPWARSRHFLLLLLLLAGTAGCSKGADPDIFCLLTLSVQTPDGTGVNVLQIDNGQEGNILRNLNTRESYRFPVFVAGKCRLQVLRGVYEINFDGTAALDDGRTRRVRCAGNVGVNAVDCSAPQTEVKLKLLYLQ